MVEAETFGSEFVTLYICKELIVVLRYKLRMFGVPLDGPAVLVFGWTDQRMYFVTTVE